MSRKDIGQLLDQARSEGAIVSRARSGHWRVVNPATGGVAQICATPQGARSVLNARTRLRRIGLVGRA